MGVTNELTLSANTISEPATMPGTESGSVTRQNAIRGLAPRFWAARTTAGSIVWSEL